jgi:hypothetical protein
MPLPFGQHEAKPNVRIGTTSPIFVPRGPDSLLVNPGDYYWIKVHSAQAAYRGSIFDKPKGMVVTSKVNLNHALLGNEEVYAIQRTREVKKGSAEQLGLSSNLVSLVPATMPRVSVAIEFILDKESNLAKLGDVINGDGFLTVLSLAPGAAAVAKTVGGLAKDIIKTFVPAEERAPILQFAGDFNVGTTDQGDALRDGYYVILGSCDDKNPLPASTATLGLGATALLVDGAEATQWSYVVLDVTRLPARTREMSAGALWDGKLATAESTLREAVEDPFAEPQAIQEAWGKCKALLQEARTLLLADPNYTTAEAEDICRAAYKSCADMVRGGAKAGLEADTEADRAALSIPLDDAVLDKQVAAYDAEAEVAKRVLRENKMLKEGEGSGGE